jgi:hypothetical protein
VNLTKYRSEARVLADLPRRKAELTVKDQFILVCRLGVAQDLAARLPGKSCLLQCKRQKLLNTSCTPY